MTKGKEIRTSHAEDLSAAKAKQQQLHKIKQAVEAAEKRLCKPIQVCLSRCYYQCCFGQTTL
jgi:hypothetical protein